MNREAYEDLLANILRRNPNMTRTEATKELREMWGIAVDAAAPAAAASRPEPALSTPKRTETKGEGDADDEDAEISADGALVPRPCEPARRAPAPAGRARVASSLQSWGEG